MLESKRELNKTLIQDLKQTEFPERYTKPFAQRTKKIPTKTKVEMPKIKRKPTQMFYRCINNTGKGLHNPQL